MKAVAAVALVVIAVLVTAAPPTYADGRGHFEAHRGFEGQRAFERHERFEGHHHLGGVFIGAPFFWGAPYYYAPAAPVYVAPQPSSSYYYYCPSYGAYYPNVGSCPEPWVPVPAS